MSKVAWDYIVPVKLPDDLKGVEPGKLPDSLLRPAVGGGKLHWIAAAAWAAMVEKAKADGVDLKPVSAGDTYRTFESQLTVFKQRYQKEPIAGAQTRTFQGVKWYKKDPKLASLASPGTSQHNLGIAVDVHTAAEPKRLKWLIDNVATFGFSWEVVPEEPWHLRYVKGSVPPPAVAEYMQKNNITPPPPGAAFEGQQDDDGKLSKGDKGPKVKELQTKLTAKGFACQITGDFTDDTVKALNAFKKSVNLQENGVCNNKVLKALA